MKNGNSMTLLKLKHMSLA